MILDSEFLIEWLEDISFKILKLLVRFVKILVGVLQFLSKITFRFL